MTTEDIVEEIKAAICEMPKDEAIKFIAKQNLLDIQRRGLYEWVENNREPGYAANYKNLYYIRQKEKDFLNNYKEEK